MKKITIVSLVFGLTLILGIGSMAYAQASKAAIQYSNMILLDTAQADEATAACGTGWVSLYDPDLKIKNGSGSKDFLVGVSLECGTWTDTTVKGQQGGEAEAEAWAGVRVRVVLDPGTPNQKIANPYNAPTNLTNVEPFGPDFGDGIVYCKRDQKLRAILGGVLTGCTTTCTPDSVTGAITCTTTCTFTDEEIQLTLRTLEASHFNFVLHDVGESGSTHAVDVQVCVDKGTKVSDVTATSSAGADAKAIIGRGTLTVEEVRLVKDADGVITF